MLLSINRTPSGRQPSLALAQSPVQCFLVPPRRQRPIHPNCTAADLARVSSGVSAATSDYLFAHPDVNAFFTGLKGQPRSAVADDVQNYLNANPQVQADLQGIRQPLVDFRNGCGVPAPNPLAPEPTG